MLGYGHIDFWVPLRPAWVPDCQVELFSDSSRVFGSDSRSDGHDTRIFPHIVAVGLLTEIALTGWFLAAGVKAQPMPREDGAHPSRYLPQGEHVSVGIGHCNMANFPLLKASKIDPQSG